MINESLSKISEFGIRLIQWFGDFSKDIKVLQIRTLNSIIRFLEVNSTLNSTSKGQEDFVDLKTISTTSYFLISIYFELFTLFKEAKACIDIVTEIIRIK